MTILNLGNIKTVIQVEGKVPEVKDWLYEK